SWPVDHPALAAFPARRSSDLCLVADLQELKANPDRPATGVVLEAKLDRGRGPVATVLVQNGTLRTSDNFVVGNVYGKVRAMFDEDRKSTRLNSSHQIISYAVF